MSSSDIRANQVVMITGAGAGLGEAMARRFHRAGAEIIACDVAEDRIQALADSLGSRVMPLVMDVTSEADWAGAIQQSIERFGRVDVLINNAGVAAAGRLEDTSLEDWRWVMEIDLFGVMLGCQAILPTFRQQGSGHIINVASMAGLAGAPEINAYGTAKAGVIAMSEMLRAEVTSAGIEVSALCPAFVKTRLTETMRANHDGYEKRVKRWMETSGVSADDVAEVVYQAVLKPKFLLLTHPQTKWLWRLKRWAPELYFKFLMRGIKKAQRRVKEAASSQVN